MSENNDEYTFIEVCAGAGGLSSGFIEVGLKPILLNDIDKNCCQTLKLNHDKVKIKCCSMNELKLKKFKSKIDVLAGGVPCQSFSLAGKKKGLDDPRGDLLLQFMDLIKKIQPKIFIIENVKGLVIHNSGNTIKEIKKGLKCDDMYKVRYKVLNAVNYGVPQKRERVFIVGINKEYDVKFKYPKKNDEIVLLKNVLHDVPESDGYLYSEEKKNLFKLIPQGGCWINLPVEQQKKYLGKSYFSGGGKRGILKRLSMDEPSLTLLCSPSQKQTERCHPLYDRPLTIREYARIQTFDDNYEFSGSISSQYKQIGNAVPVKLAKAVGISLIECLDQM